MPISCEPYITAVLIFRLNRSLKFTPKDLLWVIPPALHTLMLCGRVRTIEFLQKSSGIDFFENMNGLQINIFYGACSAPVAALDLTRADLSHPG